jgi:filamentous hemagglutinin
MTRFSSRDEFINTFSRWLVDNCEDNWSDLISPDRAQHILYGDAPVNPHQIPGVGGHLYPGGPTKTPFPANWSANQVLNHVADIITAPTTKWYVQSGSTKSLLTSKGNPAVWVAWEVRDGTTVFVVFEPATGKVRTAFPQSIPTTIPFPVADRSLW